MERIQNKKKLNVGVIGVKCYEDNYYENEIKRNQKLSHAINAFGEFDSV